MHSNRGHWFRVVSVAGRLPASIPDAVQLRYDPPGNFNLYPFAFILSQGAFVSIVTLRE
jgi:hypothetical protein